MTENKSNSSMKTFVIKPVSSAESKNALKELKKNQIKTSLINKLNEAMKIADKSVDEITLKPLSRIFSTTPNYKTMIHLRHGSKIFFDGILDEMIVRGNTKTPNNLTCDNYEAKKVVLKQILETINDKDQFDSLYKKFSAKKSSSKNSTSTEEEQN